MTDYLNGFHYENMRLRFFATAEGCVDIRANSRNEFKSANYVYNYTDHLGNVRLSYMDSNNNGSVNSDEIVEENNYYPFGLEHKGYNNVVNGVDHPYGFGNKEEQDELGLNWLDFGARNYDPALGRWMNLDPLAEEYFNLSPYNYVSNTPIRAIDPNGMEIIIIGDKEYTQQIIDYLAKLGSSSQKGAQLILNAIKSDKKFVIFDPKNENVHGVLDNFNSDNEDGGYETLGYDVSQADGEYDSENGRNGEGLVKTGETELAHELSHFNSGDNDVNRIPGTNIGRDEVNAVKEENQVRREMGLPERTHYGGINVYGKRAQSSSSRLVKDKDYSVNVNGIGKKSFQIIFKYYTNMKYEPLNNKFYKGGRLLNRQLKDPTQKKQLILNDN